MSGAFSLSARRGREPLDPCSCALLPSDAVCAVLGHPGFNRPAGNIVKRRGRDGKFKAVRRVIKCQEKEHSRLACCGVPMVVVRLWGALPIHKPGVRNTTRRADRSLARSGKPLAPGHTSAAPGRRIGCQERAALSRRTLLVRVTKPNAKVISAIKKPAQGGLHVKLTERFILALACV